MKDALTWGELQGESLEELDRANGPCNSQANIRLFGKSEQQIRIILYRDHHGWCPYCQKLWLWLEFKEIPYRIKKVTMRCYGKKEEWFLSKVPSGMLPALELDGNILTESDVILLALEKEFGTLGMPIASRRALELRHLERVLFHSWCKWLCTPNMTKIQDQQYRNQYQLIAKKFEKALAKNNGPWLETEAPSSIDLIFVPYIERMNASLAYYKGFLLRQEHPKICLWLRAFEQLEPYRGTQSDFHTHAHDLPPQMGGCWSNDQNETSIISALINNGSGMNEMEACWPENANEKSNMSRLALTRVLRHKDKLLSLNPIGAEKFDQPLRSALTRLIKNTDCKPDTGSASALRYLRDRISVPRDMPLPAARLLRQALEATAEIDGSAQPKSLPKQNRYDQNPAPFINIR